MSDTRETLSYTISATDNRATAVIAGVRGELEKLHRIAQSPLRVLNTEMATLGARKPIEFVKADQALQLARTEEQTRKLTKAVSESGVATKLQAAELATLSQRHQLVQRELDRTAVKHAAVTKAATVASVGILGAAAATVAGAVKQGIALEDLGKRVQQQSGLADRATKALMDNIRSATAHAPFAMQEVADAAVLLKTRFHETGPEIEKNSLLLDYFAKRAGMEVTPAVRGLANVLIDYRRPLSEVNKLTDEMISVSQLTQQPLGVMEGTIERFGPKLQAMGLGLKDSIRLFGVMGETGIKGENLGRGLAAALTYAQKQLGGAAGPQAALDQQAKAVDRAREKISLLGLTLPKTTAEQLRHEHAVKEANRSLGEAEGKYESLKKVIDLAGGSHASSSKLIANEIGQLEHAKSATEAQSIALTDFGKQAGPIFERAFYNNKKAIEATEKAQKEYGKTQAGLKQEEESWAGKRREITNEWHDIELTLSEGVIPALKTFLGLVSGGLKDVDKFTKGNASLAEALGAVGTLGAGAFLLRKPIGAAVHGVEKVLGIGKDSGGGSTIAGIRGTALPGSVTNPIMVRMEGGGGGGPGLIPKTVVTDIGSSAAAMSATAVSIGSIALLFKTFMSPPEKTIPLPKGERLIRESIEKGKPIPHTYGSEKVTTTYAPGSGPEFHPSAAERAAGTPRGQQEAGAVGGPKSKVSVQDVREAAVVTKEYTAASRALVNANAAVKASQEGVNNAVASGRKGTPEYARYVKELSDAESSRRRALEALSGLAAKGQYLTPVQKQQLADFKAGLSIAQQAALFSKNRASIEADMRGLDGEMKTHPSAAVARSVEGNFQQIIAGIETQMKAGKLAAAKGMEEIQKAVGAEEVILFGHEGVALNLKGERIKGSAEAGGTPGHAKGGRVPGPVTGDSWTLVNPAGRPAAKVGGSELLIANRHTEADASKATVAMYGKTLGQMVAGESLPHSAAPRFATGGRTHYDRLIEAANRVSAANFPYHWGGGHENPARLEPFDCSGAVSYAVQQAGYRLPTETSGGIPAWHFPAGPGAATIFYNADHTFMRIGGRYWGTSGFARPGGGAGWFTEPANPTYLKAFNTVHLPDLGVADSAIGVPTIVAPKWRGPGGAIGAIGSAVLAKASRAATSRVAQLASRAGLTIPPGDLTGQELKDGKLVAASEFGGANDPSAFNKPTASGAVANASLWGFAELSNPPSSLNFSALGGLPMGTQIKVGYHGRSVTVPKVDVGAGGPGLEGKPRAIDLTYAASHALGAPGLEVVRWAKAAQGGRVNYAGEFGAGGSVTADKPTMAMFGEKGRETAVFLPHAATGIRLGSQGIAETEGINPETHQLQWHTSEEWKQLSLHHQLHEQRLKQQQAALRALHASEKALSAQASGILATTRAAEPSEALGAASAAISGLSRLMREARAKHFTTLAATLRKDVEWAFKWAASTITRMGTEAPPGREAVVSAGAVKQLSRLIDKARSSGHKSLEVELLRDLGKEIAAWQSSIASAITRATKRATVNAQLSVAAAAVSQLHKGTPASRIKLATAVDPKLLVEEERLQAKAVTEYEAEAKAIHKLVAHEQHLLKQLQAKLRREVKKHHGHMAKVLKGEIAALDAALGEAESQIEEVGSAIATAQINEVELKADYEHAVQEGLQKTIDEVRAVFDYEVHSIDTREKREEGERELEGKSFKDLEEIKTTQGGVLTPAQQQQAQEDLATYKARHEEEITAAQRQKEADERFKAEHASELSPEQNRALEEAIGDLGLKIIELKDGILGQEKATKKLTEATNSATKAFGGTVGFEYQGQQYTVGQSSASAPNIMVGV